MIFRLCTGFGKSELIKAYSDHEIKFINVTTDIIILFKMSNTMWNKWYNNRNKDPKLEKKRIIAMAGHLVLEDIRNVIYDTNNYTLPNFSEQNIYENIPESLTDFLNIVIKSHKNNKKTNKDKWNKRVCTISLAIISSARPRSFLSNILIGLSAMMHKKRRREK